MVGLGAGHLNASPREQTTGISFVMGFGDGHLNASLWEQTHTGISYVVV